MAEEPSKEYMFDLSLLLDSLGYAVRCRTEEQARKFTAYVASQHPEKFGYWSHGETNWGIHGAETAYSLCYLDEYDDDGSSIFEECRLTYGSAESYEDEGFTILEFEDVFVQLESIAAEAAQSVNELLELFGVIL